MLLHAGALVLELEDAHALRWALQRLRAELLQRALAVQGQDAHRVVHAAHLEARRSNPLTMTTLAALRRSTADRA